LSFVQINEGISDTARSELGLVDDYRLAVLEQNIAYDGRDNPITPHSGFYAEVRLEQANSLWGSKFDFATVSPEVRGFLPLGGRTTLAARARGGMLASGSSLPITRRFFGGGATHHRGFSQRRLSPVESNESTTVGVGGAAMWITTLEARIEVTKLGGRWLELATFVDAGDVTRELQEIDLRDPHVAVGGGFRYHTPVGPFRIDVGYRVNRTGRGEPDPSQRWALHLSLGEAF
jgi:translocation and assembly module TamA